jgi:hypothetical protein
VRGAPGAVRPTLCLRTDAPRGACEALPSARTEPRSGALRPRRLARINGRTSACEVRRPYRYDRGAPDGTPARGARRTGATSSRQRGSVSARSWVRGARTRQTPFGSSTNSREVKTCASSRSRTNASTSGRIGSIASSANESRLRWSLWSTPSVGSQLAARGARRDSDSSRRVRNREANTREANTKEARRRFS